MIGALENGIGIHHGKFPKYIQNEVLRLFNNKAISYLFCTSTIIEGVNTSAKNVVIINNSVGNKTMTAFTLKNIKGRAGRYYHHNLGRVFYMDQKQRQIEESDNGQMNFKTYDMNSISNIDIDNSFVEDLIGNNQKEKIERDKKLNRRLLPDNVFVKNRLYARDVQEKYIRYLMREDVFCKFSGLINNSNNISFFLNQHMIVEILNSFEITGIIGMNKAKVYSAVVAKYSHFGTKGILAYHLKRFQNNSENLEDNPKQAEIHIQTNAPAPPETIAVATPTIFPVPIVAASAVVNAENGDTSPSPLLFVLDSLLNVFLIAQGRFLQVKKLQRIVKRIPVPTRRTSITGPHTKASTSDMILLNIFIAPL